MNLRASSFAFALMTFACGAESHRDPGARMPSTSAPAATASETASPPPTPYFAARSHVSRIQSTLADLRSLLASANAHAPCAKAQIDGEAHNVDAYALVLSKFSEELDDLGAKQGDPSFDVRMKDFEQRLTELGEQVDRSHARAQNLDKVTCK